MGKKYWGQMCDFAVMLWLTCVALYCKNRKLTDRKGCS